MLPLLHRYHATIPQPGSASPQQSPLTRGGISCTRTFRPVPNTCLCAVVGGNLPNPFDRRCFACAMLLRPDTKPGNEDVILGRHSGSRCCPPLMKPPWPPRPYWARPPTLPCCSPMHPDAPSAPGTPCCAARSTVCCLRLTVYSRKACTRPHCQHVHRLVPPVGGRGVTSGCAARQKAKSIANLNYFSWILKGTSTCCNSG